MFLRELHLIPHLAYHINIGTGYDSGERCCDYFLSYAVHDPAVYVSSQFSRVRNTLGNLLNNLLITLAICRRCVIADKNITALKGCIKFGELIYNILVQIEDAAVILTQLLNAVFRNITSADKVLQKTGRYPFTILHLTLLVRKLLDEVRIHQLEREVWFKNTPHRHPIDTGALQADF